MSRITSRSFYLRIIILVLLLGLGAAVLYQTVRQGFVAVSVSAYYYTPISAIFVAALVGIGVCMIAIRPTFSVESGMLKLAGMLAAVTATVPTARGQDVTSAVQACEEGGGTMMPMSGTEDCPTEQTLREAGADAGTISILVLGGLFLIATVVYLMRARREPSRDRKADLRGMAVSLLVLVAGVVVLWLRRDWFLQYAHFVAGVGLFVCVLFLTLARGLTAEEKLALATRPLPWVKLPKILFNLEPRRYAWVAWAMVAGAATMVPLWHYGVVSLFWLEMVIGALFVLFWFVQTTDPDASTPTTAAPTQAGRARVA